MHKEGGKLNVTNITGQQPYLELNTENGLKPSVERASMRFRGSVANDSHLLLTRSHVIESTG